MADPIGVALHIARQLLLLHVSQRLAQLAGGLALGGHQVAHGVLHLLLELLEVLDLAVFLTGKLLRLLAGDTLVLRAVGAAHLAFEILLAAGQFRGLAGEVVHLPAGFLAAHPGERLLRLFQTVGRAPGLGLALRRAGLLGGCRLAHIVHCLLQTVEGLPQLLRVGAARPARLLALLAWLAVAA